MRVLFLGDPASPLTTWLREAGATVTATAERLDPAEVLVTPPDLVVSYNYHYLVHAPVLRAAQAGAVNLHISCLPWNRGYDPNIWSHLEGTPSGVTVHVMDAGLDTGDIIAQELVEFSGMETLRESWESLQDRIQALFKSQWPLIRSGAAPRSPQPPGGSIHFRRERQSFAHLLAAKGYETTINELRLHQGTVKSEWALKLG